MANDEETETTPTYSAPQLATQQPQPQPKKKHGSRSPRDGLAHVHARLPVELVESIRRLRHQKRQTLAGWLELTLQAAVDLADEYSPAVADRKHASRRRG
jgi:hypothetical protein